MPDLKTLVGDVLKKSEFLAAVKKVNAARGKSILFGGAVRPLKAQEIEVLKAQRNSCSDWARILVAKDFQTKSLWDNFFAGPCVIGTFKKRANPGSGGTTLPAGLYRSVIFNSEIGNDVTIHNCGLINNYVIGQSAVVVSVSLLSAAEGTNFGVGRELPIACETGGREVALYPELTIGVSAEIARNRADKALLEGYSKFVAQYAEAAKCKKGIVEAGARIANTGRVVDTYVGPGAVIDNATAVLKSVLLSTADEKTQVLDGAYVSSSILQWGSEATTMAIVDKSLCCEHSHVERHGKLTESILGPNSGVAEGEATASLLGPFVGFHHQSLLIAAMWPEGKGNVGYGANVGSNHTGKAPDQEVWPGEGTFFGLGVNIKFPANFTGSPYLLIASGVVTLPQKIDMPFALLNTPSASVPGLSPSYNEIFPGWVLSDNIYMIMRNEGKYKKRNKAKREKFVFDVFRPDTVALMIEARKRLQAVFGKQMYTEKDVPGMGKNYMTEDARKNGVDAYTFYIRYYALKGLLKKLADGADAAKVLTAKTRNAEWDFQRQLLADEFKAETDPKALLKKLAEMQQHIAAEVQSSKEKDDKRGAKTIPGYEAAHKPAADDGFVKETRKVSDELLALIAKLTR